MILISYTTTVSILALVVAVQTDITHNLNNDEISLSLSNEQVTQYKYERTIQSAATENNQDHSITTNINSEIVQTIHSSDELDLIDADSTDLNPALNVNITSEFNMLNNNEAQIFNGHETQSTLEISNTELKIEGDNTLMSSNGSKDSLNDNNQAIINVDLIDKLNIDMSVSNENIDLSDNSIVNSYQSSNYYKYIQNTADQNGGSPTTDTSLPDSNGAPAGAPPAYPNGNLPSVFNAAGNINGILTQPYMPMTYPLGVPRYMNEGVPNYPQTSNPNPSVSAPNSSPNGGAQTSATSSTDASSVPSSASQTTTTADSTGKMKDSNSDSNGNIKSSDNSIVNSYQSSNYYKYIQNTADQNGGSPTTDTSLPDSNGTPAGAPPAYPNGNLPSVFNAAGNINGRLTQPYMPMTYPLGVPRYMNEGVPNYPQTSNPNPSVSAPNSSPNGGAQTSATSSTDASSVPSSASQTTTTADSTGKMKDSNSDSNGNIKSSDNSIVNSYQSSNYYKYIQNTADQNGGSPTTDTSLPDSNGTPAGAPPAYPNGNLPSVFNAAGNINGILTQPYMPMTYPLGVPRYMNEGVPNYPQTSNPNPSVSAPNSSPNGGAQTSATSSTDASSVPSSASQTTTTADSTGKMKDSNSDSNGNIKSSDNSIVNSYQSSNYYKYIQNTADQNGGSPTTDTSLPDSNGTPAGAPPAYPNGNLPSVFNAAGNINGILTQPYMPMTYPLGVPRYMNEGVPNYPQTSNPNPSVSAPNSSPNGGAQTSATSSTDASSVPSSASQTTTTADSTGKMKDSNSDSNGNIKSSDNSIVNSYQSSNYYKYIQNTADQNGGSPTTDTSLPDSNGTPAGAPPAYPNGNLPSVFNAAGNINGRLTQPYMPMTYPLGVPRYMNEGVRNYPQTSNPNPSVSAPNSSPNGGAQTSATSSTVASSVPSSASQTTTTADSTGKMKDSNSDSNGNIKSSDNSIVNSYQSSNYYKYIQNTADQNGGSPTTDTSLPDSNGTPAGAPPAYPNGNLPSVFNAAGNINGILTQPYMPMTYPLGVPRYMNEGVPNYPQTSNPNPSVSAPNSSPNGGAQTSATSSTDASSVPSSASQITTTADSTGKMKDSNSDSNGNIKSSDNSIVNSYQSSNYYKYIQNTADQNGGSPTTDTSLPDSNGTPAGAPPAYPNGNLPSVFNAAGNINGILTQPYMPMTYPLGVPRYMNEGVPNYPQTSNPNPSVSAPNNSPNGGAQTSATSSTDASSVPSSASQTTTTADSTGKMKDSNSDSNGNIKSSDNSIVNSYQSSNYYKYIQNTADQNGGSPTTDTSLPDSNGTPAGAPPAYPNGNLPSVFNAAGNINGILTQPYMPMTYPLGVPRYMNEGVPNYPQTSNPNPSVSAPNSSPNGGAQTSATSSTDASSVPSSASQTTTTADSTGKMKDSNSDSNGNIKSSDNSIVNSYQSSNYYKYIQNTADQNGGSPTTDTSLPDSNGTPAGAPPAYPNGNLPSVFNAAGNINGRLTQPYMPMTYPLGVPRYMNEGVPNYPQTSNPNPSVSAPNSSPNGGAQTSATSSTVASSVPSSASQTTTTADSTGKMKDSNSDSNGNIKSSDNSIVNSYQSSNYYKYIQNTADQNGGSPTTDTSLPDSNGTPAGAPPAYPNGNLPSVFNAAGNINGILTQPYMPMTYPLGVPRYMNEGVPNYPQTSNPNPSVSAPNSSPNGGAQTSATSSTDASSVPSSASQTTTTADSTGKMKDSNSDSNGNIKSSDNSIVNSYQSSNYYKYIQNTADQNGGSPTTDTSLPDSNGTPAGAPPAYPNGNLPSVFNAAGNINGILTQPYMPMTYPLGVPRYMNEGVPNYPQTSNPNPSVSAPNSSPNGGAQTSATSSTDASSVPSSASQTTTTADSTGKMKDSNSDSNGNIKSSDNSIVNSYQSSNYYKYIQNTADQNGGSPTTDTSLPDSNGTPAGAPPAYPNGNLPSVFNAAGNINGILTQPYMPMTYPLGVPRYMNEGVPNYPQTSNPNPSVSAPNSSPNGGAQTSATSSTDASSVPSSASQTTTTADSTGKMKDSNSDSNGNIKSSDNSIVNSYQSSNYYKYIQNTADQNGGSPTTDTSLPDSNGTPSRDFPSSYAGSNTMSNGGDISLIGPEDFNGKSHSGYQSPSGQIPDYFSMNENPNSFPIPTWDLYGSYNTPEIPITITEPVPMTGDASMVSETYESSIYDFGYELQDIDQVQILNDEQLNINDRFIPNNYDNKNNDAVNIPIFSEDGDYYFQYFYDKSSVNTVQDLDGDYNTQSFGSNVDDYFEYDNGNLAKSPYDSYTSNLNAMYGNSQLQYELNQNSPPFSGFPLTENDIYPDNNPQLSVMNSDPFNYNNRVDIDFVEDLSIVEMDETSPENNQLSRGDFNKFSNTQILQPTNSYFDTDLTPGTYDFVDGQNRDIEIIDSNYIGQANENSVNNGQGLNEYDMQSINIPGYNQLNGDYTPNYLSNSGNFDATSLSSIGTNVDIVSLDGSYPAPQLISPENNLISTNDLNKQYFDSSSLLIDSVHLNGYLNGEIDTSNVNTEVEGSIEDSLNGSPIKTVDNRFKSIQTRVLSMNTPLDVGQNVYGTNGQVIGKIYKPAVDNGKKNNHHKYSGSSSYSSIDDSEFSDDMHEIGRDIKRATRDAINGIHDDIKDAYDTTKAVGKGVGNVVENAASEAVDDVEQAAKSAYQGTKDIAKDVGNAASEVVDGVEQTAKTAYQDTKDVANGVKNVASEAADGVAQTAKTAYQGINDVAKDVGNVASEAADDVKQTAKTAYQDSKDAAEYTGNS